MAVGSALAVGNKFLLLRSAIACNRGTRLAIYWACLQGSTVPSCCVCACGFPIIRLYASYSRCPALVPSVLGVAGKDAPSRPGKSYLSYSKLYNNDHLYQDILEI